MKNQDGLLLRIRQRLLPDSLQMGWTPVYSLGYLLFLFVPLILSWLGDEGKLYVGPYRTDYTLLSVLVFLPLYFLGYRNRASTRLACILGMAVLCYALMPYNSFSNTYLIYVASFVPFLGMKLVRGITLMLSLLVLMLLEVMWLGYPLFVFVITLLISIPVLLGSHFYLRDLHKQTVVKHSDEEIRRLAASAERERIGRDLHDLLGHTLSLVALKSDLAGKLLDTDVKAARQEMDEVSRVARDALLQVRRAVSGIRATGLAAELASARVMLESSGVVLDIQMDEVELSAADETVLALVLREAVTNIQRHARARHVRITLQTAEDGGVALVIQDDGRTQTLNPGNGICGMRERVTAQGGRLRVQPQPGQGIQVRAWLPARPLHDRAAGPADAR